MLLYLRLKKGDCVSMTKMGQAKKKCSYGKKGIALVLALMLLLGCVPEYSVYAANNEKIAYSKLTYGKVPKVLKGRKLSNKKIQKLDVTNPEELKKQLSTLEDVIAWFNLLDYSWCDGGAWCNSPSAICHYYMSPKEMLCSEVNMAYTGHQMHFGTDCLSYIAAWLLEDDFSECGVILGSGMNTMTTGLAFFRVDSNYYVINVAHLVNKSKIMYELVQNSFDFVKASSKNAFSEIAKAMAKEGRCDSVISTNQLDQRIVYYQDKNAKYFRFEEADGIEKLYEKSKKNNVEDIVINRKKSFSITEYHLPAALGEATLTCEQAIDLVGKEPKTIAEKVKTLADVYTYFYAAAFRVGNGDIQVQDGDVFWHFNYSGETALRMNMANCGATANTVKYLLDGDYDEVGYIHQTYYEGQGGGHVYNYIKHKNRYCVVDMTLYNSSDYSPYCTSFVEVNNLKQYGSKYQQLYNCEIPVIYAYNQSIEMPITWGQNVYVTGYPNNVKIQKIKEDKENGYSLKKRVMSDAVRNEIDQKRKIAVIPETAYETEKQMLEWYGLPEELGQITVSKEDMMELIDQPFAEVAEKIRTIPDALLYLCTAGFTSCSGDIKTEGSGGQMWHYNYTAEKVNTQKVGNCGGTANLIRALLDGDFDEVGYIQHTLRVGQGGGHVYNYIKQNGRYYVMDFSKYIGAKCTRFDWVDVGTDLKEYAHQWQSIFFEDVKTICAYKNPVEIPLSWDVYKNEYNTKFPTSEKKNICIIMESPNEGYTYGFYKLSKKLKTYIDSVR